MIELPACLPNRLMKINYDVHTDCLTVILKDGVVVAESDEDKPGVILDYDDGSSLATVDDQPRAAATTGGYDSQTSCVDQSTLPTHPNWGSWTNSPRTMSSPSTKTIGSCFTAICPKGVCWCMRRSPRRSRPCVSMWLKSAWSVIMTASTDRTSVPDWAPVGWDRIELLRGQAVQVMVMWRAK